MIAAAVVVDLGLRAAYAGEILPGVRMAGIDLGGMTPAEARQALAAAFSPDQSVTLAHGARRFRVRAGEVGYRLDAARSAQRAYRTGRDNGMGGLAAAVAGLAGGRDIAPAVEVERARMRAHVAAIARQVDVAPFDGGLAVLASSPRIRAVGPRAGLVLDQQAAATRITTALSRRAIRLVALPVAIRRAVARRHVDAVARTARAYAQTPLRLRGARRTVTLAGRDLAAVLDVEPTGARRGPPLRLGVHTRRLGRVLATLAREVGRAPVDARLSVAARPVEVDAKGDLTWRPRSASVRVSPARPGRTLDRRATASSVASAVRRQRHSARLAVDRVPASLTTTAARDVTSILGTFTSRFACCQPRATNIRLIAKAVDTAVIRPDEQFSLNAIAGPRTAAKGYRRAPFIADGKIVPSVGGGVSQFATAMYNAAYFAGLRIDGHQPHSFYIDRYPPGREATLDYPGIDLAWTNDTKTPVFVRATADATSVTVTLYGAGDVRRVNARSGPRVPRGDGGFTMTVTRTVARRAGRTTQEAFTTTYDAPPAEP